MRLCGKYRLQRARPGPVALHTRLHRAVPGRVAVEPVYLRRAKQTRTKYSSRLNSEPDTCTDVCQQVGPPEHHARIDPRRRGGAADYDPVHTHRQTAIHQPPSSPEAHLYIYLLGIYGYDICGYA